jgi:hypothetical protein
VITKLNALKASDFAGSVAEVRCPRLSFARSRAVIASDTVSRQCKSIAVCQPLLYSRLPTMPTRSPLAQTASFSSAAPSRFFAHDADEVLHHRLQVVCTV